MRYSIVYTSRFKKDLKRCARRGLDLALLFKAIKTLEEGGMLPQSYKTHKLSGDYKGCLECHIQPDWLLVWKQDDCILELLLMNTGSHSDLF